MRCAGLAPQRRAAVARLTRRLAAHCQALAAPPPLSAAAVDAGGGQGPGAPGARRPDAVRGPEGSKGLTASAAHRRSADGREGEGLGVGFMAHLLARRCLAEAAALAAALGGRYDASALGVLLLHLTAVRRWVAVLFGREGGVHKLHCRRAGHAATAPYRSVALGSCSVRVWWLGWQAATLVRWVCCCCIWFAGCCRGRAGSARTASPSAGAALAGRPKP